MNPPNKTLGGACSSGWLSEDCPSNVQQLPEIVVPSGYSADMWTRRAPPSDPRQLLLSTHLGPMQNITAAVQSVWNAKEGRKLATGPGTTDTPGQSVSFLGFDLHRNGGVVTQVLASDVGTWKSTPDCPTPKAWLFLFGHYRTFDFARHSQAAAMDLATGGCYFVVAAVWPVVAASDTHGKIRDMLPSNSPKRGRDKNDNKGRVNKAAMLQATEDFGGRLAFAILSRDFEKMILCKPDKKGKKSAACKAGGNIRSQFSTSLPWHTCWELARWAAATHGFEVDPYSTVIRTRPDYNFEASWEIAPLRRVFEKGTDDGRDGLHLALGTLQASDIFQMMSFAAYETDIAMPIATGVASADADQAAALLAIGAGNGWAMGMLEWERRLRPPMLFTYAFNGLGRLLRVRDVSIAKQIDWVNQTVLHSWPMLKYEVTKGVR